MVNPLTFRRRFKNETIEKIMNRAEKGLTESSTKSEKNFNKEKNKFFREESKTKRQYNRPTASGLNRATVLMQNNMEKAKKREYNPAFKLGK